MGYFSQLALEVEELLFQGLSDEEIAQKLNLSLEEVNQQIAMLEEADYDQYDGQPDEYTEWMDFDPDC